MSSTVFLTGATGFLGTQVARRLMAMGDLRLIALVRGKDQQEAASRLERTWWPWPEIANAIGTRVEVLAGDVSLPHLGLGLEDYERLSVSVTHVVHSAADLRLDGPIDELRMINVQGTAAVIELARRAHSHHGLKRFAHVSTAYVAGRRTGPVPEDALTDEHGFSNTYEQTKFEGERLVRATGESLPVSIFRPGMIVGDSNTGEIATFNTVYVPLKLYLTGKLRVMPCRGNLPVNVVPVDYVADAISRLTFDSRAEGRTFHLTVPPRLLPTARELLECVREWAATALKVQLAPPVMLPVAMETLDRKVFRAIPKALVSYFSEDREFQTSNTESLLGPCVMDWKGALPRLLAYAVARGFLHASGRTAHEQVQFRLQSRTRQVRFHEIRGGKAAARSASEVREEILQASSSLRAMGVARGDRVAIAGLNGVRYLVLDVAMGLAGAVSVPLYYTTPAAEMEEILRASRSRLLFIGAPLLFSELEKTGVRIPTISFCHGQAPRSAMPWEEFLRLGSGRDHEAPARNAPIRLCDEATVRFTSGTTGQTERRDLSARPGPLDGGNARLAPSVESAHHSCNLPFFSAHEPCRGRHPGHIRPVLPARVHGHLVPGGFSLTGIVAAESQADGVLLRAAFLREALGIVCLRDGGAILSHVSRGHGERLPATSGSRGPPAQGGAFPVRTAHLGLRAGQPGPSVGVPGAGNHDSQRIRPHRGTACNAQHRGGQQARHRRGSASRNARTNSG